MQLRSVEKTVVVLLIIIAIVGAGTYFFIYPNYTKIQETEAEILLTEDNIAAALAAIADGREIEKQFSTALERAQEAESYFYPEMPYMDAIAVVEELLAAGGYKAKGNISVSRLVADTLSLEERAEAAPESVDYELRDFSFLESAGEASEGEETATDSAEAGTRQELLAALRAGEVPPEEIDGALEYARLLMQGQSVGVGQITASFTLELTYAGYVRFVEYIGGLKEATGLDTAEFFPAHEIEAGARDYSFTLKLYVVNRMEVPEFVTEYLKD